jgi:hypothetical protein
MKKCLLVLLLLAAVLVAVVPAVAVDFKYGGYYFARWITSDNVTDGNSNLDDNQNYFDQRLRLYFDFIASENLRLVTKYEVDTLWGNNFDKFDSGGGVGADSINFKVKNAYVDFAVPQAPVRASLGVQGLAFLTGWVIDDDFSGALFTTELDPVAIKLGYIAAQNNNVTDASQEINDWFLNLDYSHGPFAASFIVFYQYGHDAVPVGVTAGGPFVYVDTEDNQLVDLGLALNFKMDWLEAYLNTVQNLGSYDLATTGKGVAYRGFMVEAGANLNYDPLTFTLGGFYTSGDTDPDDDTDNAFSYPIGKSHYWSEIMGLGTLDTNVGGSYLNPVRPPDQQLYTGADDRLNPDYQGGYTAADYPSNLWTITAGVAWQALEKTKLTLNYYYIGTDKSVLGNYVTGEKDRSIGNEVDFYVDQEVLPRLDLRLVAAYLFAGDAYTVFPDDDNAYKAGAVFQFKF